MKHTFQPKIFRLKFRYLIIKVLVGTIGKHSKRHFSAENIRFEFGILEFGIFHIHVVALAHPSTHSVHTPPILDIDENVAIYATCTQHVL